jgi:hypothetical protein
MQGRGKCIDTTERRYLLIVIPAKEDVKESDFTDFVGPD